MPMYLETYLLQQMTLAAMVSWRLTPLEYPSRDQGKQDERTQAEQL